MIFASKKESTRAARENESIQPIEARMQLYSPRHDEVLYETTMPFFNDDQDERFWVGFCFRGGRGLNSNGVSVADAVSVMQMKPSVENQCILDKSNVPTVAITAPLNVNTKTISQDVTEITWEQSQKPEEPQIAHYRIFI